MTPAPPELAGLDDVVEITGDVRHERHFTPYQSKLQFTWGEIFAALAPHIFEEPNETLMKSHYQAVVLELYLRRGQKRWEYWHANEEDYQSVKVQLMALKLDENCLFICKFLILNTYGGERGIRTPDRAFDPITV
jgi:hypothetical protein